MEREGEGGGRKKEGKREGDGGRRRGERGGGGRREGRGTKQRSWREKERYIGGGVLCTSVLDVGMPFEMCKTQINPSPPDSASDEGARSLCCWEHCSCLEHCMFG